MAWLTPIYNDTGVFLIERTALPIVPDGVSDFLGRVSTSRLRFEVLLYDAEIGPLHSVLKVFSIMKRLG